MMVTTEMDGGMAQTTATTDSDGDPTRKDKTAFFQSPLRIQRH